MIDGRIAVAMTAVGSTLTSLPIDVVVSLPSSITSRRDSGSQPSSGIGPAERHERARSIADGVAHHFGELARERPLPPLHALSREDVILEHEIVGDGGRHDHQPGRFRDVSAACSSPVFGGFSSPL